MADELKYPPGFARAVSRLQREVKGLTAGGAWSPEQAEKLANIESGATRNATNAQLRDRSSHTGTQSLDTITETDEKKIMTGTERTGLAALLGGTSDFSANTLSVGGFAFSQIHFGSRSAFETATIPVWVTSWTILHYGVVVWYRRDDTGTAIISANGVKGSPADKITPLHWGLVTGNRSFAATNSAAVNAADAWAKSKNQILWVPGGVIFISAMMTMTATWSGQGCGYWPVQPATSRPAAEQAIQVAPTQFVTVGTFARNLTVPGISSMDCSGATRDNPSARGAGYNDSQYKLLSFMNDDGSLRSFSAAIFATGNGLASENFRIIPDFGGDDGQDGYELNTQAARSTSDVDIGFLAENVSQCLFSKIAAVGHWRMYGRLQLQILMDETASVTGSSYHSAWNKCHFQGFVGAGQRGSDIYKIISVAANKVYLPWSDDIAIQSLRVWTTARWNATGGYSTSVLPAAITAVAEVGGQCEITFAADVSGTLSAGNFIIARGVGGGDSHTHETDCKYQGFTHSNGGMAHDGNKVTAPFAYPSKAYEKSGWRGTETVFNDPQFQHVEEVFFHIHDADQITFYNIEFEKIVDTGSIPTNHARIISSANVTTHHPYNAGFCYRMAIHVPNKIDLDGLDLGPNIPVTRANTFNGVGDVGFLEAQQLTIPSYGGSVQFYTPYLVPFKNAKAGIKKAGWPFPADAFAYNDATGKLEQSAPLVNLERPYINTIAVSGGGSVLYQSGREALITIPVGAVATVTLSGNTTNIMGYVTANSADGGGGIFRGRASTSPFCRGLALDLMSVSILTLDGTNGTAGNVNVSCVNGGIIYIANQTSTPENYLLELGL